MCFLLIHACMCRSHTAEETNHDPAALGTDLGMIDHCIGQAKAKTMTCGKILAHATQKVTSFREKMGIKLTCFKIGVTTDPFNRFQKYKEVAFTEMWLIFQSDSVDLVHMLEASLILHFHQHVGCQNKKGTGGEGFLNRSGAKPPFYVYVTGGRADQMCRVG